MVGSGRATVEEEGKKGGQRKRKCEYKSGHQGIRLLKRPLILFQHSTKDGVECGVRN